MSERYLVEPIGSGYMVVDTSGKRGKFGEAYMGSDGVWNFQPIVPCPFPDKESADKAVEELNSY